MKIIARIRTPWPEKFGVPRQPGLVSSAKGKIIFEPEFRNPDALRELETFSHLWLLFLFDKNHPEHWKATVRPPRLGGNTRIGVFASRSPFRPNPIGLSLVSLKKIQIEPGLGHVLYVSCPDLVDLTPIIDIKPYLPYADSPKIEENLFAGFASTRPISPLKVECPATLLAKIPEQFHSLLIETLASDPRPAYHNKTEHFRNYHTKIESFEITWNIVNETTCQILDIIDLNCQN